MLSDRRFGRYENLEKIGEGGMGEIYSAHDPELNRAVAIKVLSPEFVADKERKTRFRQEARAASALNHPNIITIFEIGDSEDGSFLATEFIEGRTLRDIIKRESLSLSAVLRIIRQVADALVAAHGANVIHRDIKPENIMVRPDSIVKVVDFGLAKPIVIERDDDEIAKTIPGMVMGSATYMSPEQARGIEVDERTDIWSVGILLYEMIAGKTPFKESTTSETIAAVIYKEAVPLRELVPSVPEDVAAIVEKALQKDVSKRYQKMRDLSADLGEAIYTLEHSGERAHDAPVMFSDENPTMIHRTDSAGHRTQYRRIDTQGTRAGGRGDGFAGFLRKALAIIAGIIFTAAVSLGIYTWLGSEEPLASGAFARTQTLRVATDGKVDLGDISPDGKYVAYIEGEPGSRSLVVRQLSADSVVTAVPATNRNLAFIKFSPLGDFVYYCQTSSDQLINTLYRVPKLGGTPKKLIEDVDSAVTFSPDGKRFAFVRHTTSNHDLIIIADAETLETEQLISTEDTEYSFFGRSTAWSPKGNSILVAAGNQEGGFVAGADIVEISLADRTVKPLPSSNFFIIGDLVWFADGSGYLFTARKAENAPLQIFRASYPDNSIFPVTNDFNDYNKIGLSDDGRTIVTLKKDASAAVWRYEPTGENNVQVTPETRDLEGLHGLKQHPDGSLIYSRRHDGKINIYSTMPESGEPKILADDDGYAINPVITPDGKYIVYNLQKDRSSRIWRMNADGTERIPLTDAGPEAADLTPQITSDGQFVIFHRLNTTSNRGELMKVSITGGPAELFFSEEGLSIHQPRLSPDGKLIAFIIYDPRSLEKRIRISEFDLSGVGKEVVSIENNLVDQYHWAPDSKSLTVVTSRGGVPNIWREPINGEKAEPISNFRSGRIFNFAWSNDGRSLFIVRGNTINDLILIKEA